MADARTVDRRRLRPRRPRSPARRRGGRSRGRSCPRRSPPAPTAGPCTPSSSPWPPPLPTAALPGPSPHLHPEPGRRGPPARAGAGAAGWVPSGPRVTRSPARSPSASPRSVSPASSSPPSRVRCPVGARRAQRRSGTNRCRWRPRPRRAVPPTLRVRRATVPRTVGGTEPTVTQEDKQPSGPGQRAPRRLGGLDPHWRGPVRPASGRGARS